MWYARLADAIVAIHVAYMAFIILGQLAIVIGAFLKWQWIRNPWFRIAHLAAIVIVAFEAVFGVRCPLTLWEYELRVAAGQDASGESFVGRLMHNLLFHELPPWIYTSCYVGFALLVLVTLFWAPPRWRSKHCPRPDDDELPVV
jgi:Protein of Unknown function (DUF2784)